MDDIIIIIKRSTRHAKLAFMLIICFFILNGEAEAEAEAAESRMPIIDAAKRLFSLPTTFDCWILKAKSLFFQPYFPPSSGEDGRMGSRGTTEKVKEAAVKSLDESKSTVEDSARSAAKLAEEAVDNTVKKLKKTLSGSSETRRAAHQEPEL